MADDALGHALRSGPGGAPQDLHTGHADEGTEHGSKRGGTVAGGAVEGLGADYRPVSRVGR